MIQCALDRVLVVMMSALGDAVHVLPVLNALKRHHPGCHLTWVLQSGPAALVRGHAGVDEIILFERSRGWRAFGETRRALRGRRFDLVLDLQVYIKGGLVTWLADAPIKLGFDRARARDFNWLFTTHKIPPHPPQHVQDQYFEFLAALGVPHEPIEWGLGPWPEEREWQREFFANQDRPLACLVTGSSDPQREWLPERWAVVADVLYEDYGLQPVLVGGRSARELDAERVIRARARNAVVSTLGMPLRHMVSVLDGSALALSVNTGPLHVAVALNRPVISLMGYNNPKRVGPYRFQDLIVDAYGEPGEEYAPSLEQRPGRMQRITVEHVTEKIELWSRRYPLSASVAMEDPETQAAANLAREHPRRT